MEPNSTDTKTTTNTTSQEIPTEVKKTFPIQFHEIPLLNEKITTLLVNLFITYFNIILNNINFI